MVSMTDINKLLRDADPLRDRPDERLSDADAQAIRRAMVNAARQSAAAGLVWRRPFALAAAAVILIVVGGIAGDRGRERPESTAPATSANDIHGSSGELGRRQVQFATPGGTRIIWILNPNLALQEPMP
jgi:hypothetical protein